MNPTSINLISLPLFQSFINNDPHVSQGELENSHECVWLTPKVQQLLVFDSKINVQFLVHEIGLSIVNLSSPKL